MPATVKTVEYDPNRSVHIALIEYTDGVKSVHPGSERHQGVGQTIVSGPDSLRSRNRQCAAAGELNIPSGLEIHNIESEPRPGRPSWFAPPAASVASVRRKGNGP